MNKKLIKNNEIIVTLSEKDYHYGVAALINSLYKSSFSGKIIIGYKTSPPTWLIQLKEITASNAANNTTYYLSENIQIEIRQVKTHLHFGYYKPFFLKDILHENTSISNIYYFDPDIVINSNWIFFQYWSTCGVCLCLDDSYPIVHSNHPWRKKWQELNNNYYSAINSIDYYVNSGFIGLTHENSSILEKWIYFTNRYNETGGNTTIFEKSGQRAFKGDQDLLNAAITFSPGIEYSIIGQEGMGFSMPAYLMTHAIGENLKPWHNNFLLQLFRIGRRPTLAENNFFNHCEHPIKVFTKKQLLVKKLNLRAASILGRLIGL